MLRLGAYPDTSLKMARGNRDDARKLLAAEAPIDPFLMQEVLSTEVVNTQSGLSKTWARLALVMGSIPLFTFKIMLADRAAHIRPADFAPIFRQS